MNSLDTEKHSQSFEKNRVAFMLCTIYPKQDIYNVSTLIQNVERIVYNGDHYILVSILIKTHE